MASVSSETDGKDWRLGIVTQVAPDKSGANGVLVFIAIVVLIGLGGWFTIASNPNERIVAGVLIAVVLVAIIIAQVQIELGRQRSNPAVRAASNLDKPSVDLSELKSRSSPVAVGDSTETIAPGEFLSTPGGFFSIAKPSAEWTVEVMTLVDLAKEKLQTEEIPDFGPLGQINVMNFKFGNGFTYSPRPDRTRYNGGRIPILLSDTVQRSLQILPFPRRQPPYYVDHSLYDNLMQLLIPSLNAQVASLVSLTTGTLPKTNREMLVAEIVQEIEDIMIGNREVDKIRIELKYFAIRSDIFDYFFISSNVRVGRALDSVAERMNVEVSDLFKTFQIASVIDTDHAERDELAKVDQYFDAFLKANGAEIFNQQLKLTARRLHYLNLNYNSPKDMARAISILRPFKTFADMIEIKDIESSDFFAAMAATDQGDNSPLRVWLNENINGVGQPEPKAITAPGTDPLAH